MKLGLPRKENGKLKEKGVISREEINKIIIGDTTQAKPTNSTKTSPSTTDTAKNTQSDNDLGRNSRLANIHYSPIMRNIKQKKIPIIV